MSFSELAFHHCLARPGTIIDVGANVGAFSRPFSTWGGNRLIAFEPFLPIFEMLKAILIQDHGGELPTTTKLYMAALGETIGTAKLRVPCGADGAIVHPMASMARSFEGLEGVSFSDFEVPVWTIDALGVDDLTAIKIDAEGYEIEVLHGATRTLERCRPIVSCECVEIHREGVTWYIPGFMRALGYNGWFHYQGQFWPISSLDRRSMQAASPHGQPQTDPYIVTFLFIPSELDDLRQRLLPLGSFRSA
jgi:FkbM family methyltransferase